MPDPEHIVSDLDPIVLDKLRYGVAEVLGPGVAQTLQFDITEGVIQGHLVAKLTADVLAETMPPQTITDTARIEIPFYATAWQHFKAQYAGRWWMWPLRNRPIRYVNQPYAHTVTVEVANRWTYPRASLVVPPEMGGAVFQSQTSHHGVLRPW